MELKVCNLCGKELDEWDMNCDFSLCMTAGYGSIYDGEKIDLHLCTDCFDDIVNRCEVSPILGDERC